MPMRRPMATTNTATHVYSRRRNAIAPSRIAEASPTIVSFPCGVARTARAYTTARTRAATPATSATYRSVSVMDESSRRGTGKPEREYRNLLDSLSHRRSQTGWNGPPRSARLTRAPPSQGANLPPSFDRSKPFSEVPYEASPEHPPGHHRRRLFRRGRRHHHVHDQFHHDVDHHDDSDHHHDHL